MRLHRLEVTAFGPFVDSAEVDFDSLSDAGLFLLSGATGAGKSSVLDAVCFALYAAVPGDRQDAGRLRSDQAPPSLAPQVTLEVSLSGRRFRIVRSPAWERPKKRGTGTTREQARVTVSERTADQWTHLTSRLDEAGDLLSGLLGMNLDQFCQVALLPQGHFQAFLRATPDQRQRLLARLFRTGRFERVEAWLRDHRIRLRRASESHAHTVADLVSRLSEAAHRPVPESFGDLADVPESELAEWAEHVRVEAASRRTTTAAAVEGAAREHESATSAFTEARDLASARSRVAGAAETVERLDLERERHSAEADRLELGRRAAGVEPLARLVDQRARNCRDAEAGLSDVDVSDLPAELERASEQLASLTALLPSEKLLAELREQRTHHEGLLAELVRDHELAIAEATSLTALEDELRRSLTIAEESVESVPAAEVEVDRLRKVVDAHAAIARLRTEHATASADHAEARRAVVDRREHLLDLRERRIAGMAAELAGGLVVGADCPVCGSADHPHPALPSGAHPTGDTEHDAQRAVDDAQAVELAVQLRVRDLELSLAAALELAGPGDATDARDRLTEARERLDQARTRMAERESARSRLQQTSARIAEQAATTAARQVKRAEIATTLDHLASRITELDVQVSGARGDHPELGEAVESCTRQRDQLRSLRDRTTALETARASLADATTALGRAAVEAGFETAEDARDALLDREMLKALEQSVEDHRVALASARQVLDEPDAWSLLTTPEPDVRAAESRAHAAAETLEQTRAAHDAASRVDERVRRLDADLTRARDEWAPLRRELRLATSVSAFADGKASDNRLQMRLSAYVLAFRLSQVVAAANARLSGMSDQRYSLEHVGRRGAREIRGGLSLLVRDDWSGESRDPATLSGGETFVVSLALALGLADVVSHEAGGADLQTLFVDEGFGALDAETLDDVLDILDSLRENGRAVGVVSHVAEMRDRIPAQLVVTKARSGSTLQVVGAGG
jgi:exonuclease SbcC